MSISIRPQNDFPTAVDLPDAGASARGTSVTTGASQRGGPAGSPAAAEGMGGGTAPIDGPGSFRSGVSAGGPSSVLPTGQEPSGRSTQGPPPAGRGPSPDGRNGFGAGLGMVAPATSTGGTQPAGAEEALRIIAKAGSPANIQLTDWKTVVGAFGSLSADQQKSVKAQLNQAYPPKDGKANGGGDQLQYASDGMLKGDINAAENRLKELQGKA